MAIRVSYPGVYIQEVPSGVRTITGVSTSVAAFVGMIQRGKLNTPTRVLSFPDYQRKFGNDTTASEMTDQVRQFFLNGGQEAWITRIANFSGASDDFPGSAMVTLMNEAGAPVLTVIAAEAGQDGNLIRLEVDYNTPHPEETFNLRVFRAVTNAFGVVQIETDETFSDLSMNPNSRRYVETIVNQQSTLVNVEIGPDALPLTEGYSLSGLLLDNTTASATINSILSPTVNSFQISVDGSPPALVILPQPLTTIGAIAIAINNSALAQFDKHVQVELVEAGLSGDLRYLEIRSVDGNGDPVEGGSVEIQPAATNNAAVALQLGVAQGGIEIGGYALARPAPSGFFARLGSNGEIEALSAFAEANDSDFGQWILEDASGLPNHTGTPFPSPTNRPLYEGTAYDIATNPGIGSLRNVRQNLQILANSINENAINEQEQPVWQASLQGYRLVLRPLFGGSNLNVDPTATLSSDGGYNIGGAGQFFDSTAPSSANVSAYSLGSTGDGNFQAGVNGSAGDVPTLSDYRSAFSNIERNVDIFNLLILPRANGQDFTDREAIWGEASVFCQSQRSFLLVDPRETWATVNDIDSQIAEVRIGLVTDHAAIYWPRLRIPTESGGLRTIDPSGSLAGVMARIDANRGVWKAPAGLEADIRGIRDIEYPISDPENGIINPQAVNAIRRFPTGIVVWGARTMTGSNDNANTDYRYVPIRRIALFIEESLFRGLKFAVFEPNDEPLWAQIRLAAGAFMNNLFRQGAFQGQKARDAYFVKVDSETTTQNDINLGIVNVVVGFAPLRPAEFVIITLQQMAGQVQT